MIKVIIVFKYYNNQIINKFTYSVVLYRDNINLLYLSNTFFISSAILVHGPFLWILWEYDFKHLGWNKILLK